MDLGDLGEFDINGEIEFKTMVTIVEPSNVDQLNWIGVLSKQSENAVARFLADQSDGYYMTWYSDYHVGYKIGYKKNGLVKIHNYHCGGNSPDSVYKRTLEVISRSFEQRINLTEHRSMSPTSTSSPSTSPTSPDLSPTTASTSTPMMMTSQSPLIFPEPIEMLYQPVSSIAIC